jgi:hypothetical protein
MIPLTIDAAIFRKFAAAFFQFHIINFHFAAGSTYFVCLCAAHDNNTAMPVLYEVEETNSTTHDGSIQYNVEKTPIHFE